MSSTVLLLLILSRLPRKSKLFNIVRGRDMRVVSRTNFGFPSAASKSIRHSLAASLAVYTAAKNNVMYPIKVSTLAGLSAAAVKAAAKLAKIV